ncbi:hypothetical protein K469DRAFT_556166 [Zopfia rhizophila CBS 207.26]|uniref:Uncharacterized protein n=1 Tax=Zopfia rhizophila CBS 207.26 TaxID=1314779 RepID=A0A6A6EKZ1_9PEZI|nr:hypothetical protein K469DRAFT_556166 [Zopfia rhizophila CBS 207.26]
MPVVTIHDYNTPRSRQCPNLRTYWPGLSQSFNPCISDRPLMFRRCAFLSILILRLLHSTLFTLAYATSLFWLPSILLNILFFFFVAWNLHLIVEMRGERKVFGMTFGRPAFDMFLWLMALGHVWILGWDFLMAVVSFEAYGGASWLWATFLLMIFAVAWISTWEPEVSL